MKNIATNKKKATKTVFYAVQCSLDNTPQKILAKCATAEEARTALPKNPFPGFNYAIYKEVNGKLVGEQNLIPSVRTKNNFF